MTLEEACEAYLRDSRARGLSEETRHASELVLRQMRAFLADRSVRELECVDAALLRDWRESWAMKPGTQRMRIGKAKAFFRFAVESEWIARSPAKNLRPPKNDAPPTMPLTAAEVRTLIVASAEMARERALILLMRYSGLAIRDAATLSKGALEGDILTLRRAKSGTPVLCCLPDPVPAALNSIASPDRDHYFWNGRSRPRSVANYWRVRLHGVARLGGIEAFKPHRLRDTFAVELLAAGVSMQDVSSLLGHSSIQTTERYYAPWDVSRRNRLLRVVRDAHNRDPLVKWLAESGNKHKTGAAPTAPVNGSASLSQHPSA